MTDELLFNFKYFTLLITVVDYYSIKESRSLITSLQLINVHVNTCMLQIKPN